MKSIIILTSLLFSVCAFSQSKMGDLTSKTMEMGKAKAGEVMAACKDDTTHYCEKMKTADTVKACLKENYSKLSEGCKKVINPMK